MKEQKQENILFEQRLKEKMPQLKEAETVKFLEPKVNTPLLAAAAPAVAVAAMPAPAPAGENNQQDLLNSEPDIDEAMSSPYLSSSSDMYDNSESTSIDPVEENEAFGYETNDDNLSYRD